MSRIPRELDPGAPVMVIDIGNSSMGIATWHEDRIKTPLHIATDDTEAIEESFRAQCEASSDKLPAAVVIGSVVPERLSDCRALVKKLFDQHVLVVGDTIDLPIDVGVKDAKAIGVDRVCAAAAAFERLQTACTIVDFGTAVTVDLVNDDGVLLGGAILPGLELQCRALHEHAACLPEVTPEIPELLYGRDTIEAIRTGVCRGLVGAVRGLVEGYATALNRWPHVVATGGGIELMAPVCDFVDSLVPDLTLQGVGLAYQKHLSEMGA
ncbi:MAG: type III pantothenate kinase [Planctomycetes bacterium]|nr:type III pantothenate kinase [Planctomycetota bacterium]